VRRWWHGPQLGSVAPADAILDRDDGTITPGVVEMACRVNLSATSFVRAAAALERTAQVQLSGERLRQVVEAAGRGVLKAQQDDAIAVAWHAEECVVPDGKTCEKTRIYTGCDGVMVPIITDVEKIKRRDKVKAKRRRRGKKCKPLPPRRRGSDLSWKEFKVAEPKLTKLEVGADLAYAVQEATYTIVDAKGPVVMLGAETVVLAKEAKGWKIRHLHLSAKRLAPAKPADKK